ncbi:hypothetical protein BOTCAL_0139g00170 [Botryotinia calthae]|uniref:Myb-like DNA-binding domain-containing protein n=1 Tax=Botryotinia calthae TaxID=38488 RepID=A0A4Y8D3P5_9HELO|nr:hypothetical protein BOTCAL_0139g00170 [Botryotinia calthae]
MASMEEKLLMGVLTQIEVGRIDYDELAKYIDVATSKAARRRWDRYKQKFTKGGPPITPKKGAGVGKTITSVSPKKAGGSPNKNNRGSPKTSRARIKEESDEEEEEVDVGVDEDEEMDYDKKTQDLDVKEELVTPSRRVLSRRAKVTKFVEETSGAEDEEEEEYGEM